MQCITTHLKLHNKKTGMHAEACHTVGMLQLHGTICTSVCPVVKTTCFDMG